MAGEYHQAANRGQLEKNGVVHVFHHFGSSKMVK
jgi:hypothetical protein